MRTIVHNGFKTQITDELYESIMKNNPDILLESMIIDKIHKLVKEKIDAFKNKNDISKISDLSTDDLHNLKDKIIDDLNKNDALKSQAGIEDIDLNRQVQDFMNKIGRVEGSKQNILTHISANGFETAEKLKKEDEIVKSKSAQDLSSKIDVFNNSLKNSLLNSSNVDADMIDEIKQLISDYKANKDLKKWGDEIDKQNLEQLSANLDYYNKQKEIRNSNDYLNKNNIKGLSKQEIENMKNNYNSNVIDMENYFTDKKNKPFINIVEIVGANSNDKSYETDIRFKELMDEIRRAESYTRKIVERCKDLIQGRLGIAGDAVLPNFSTVGYSNDNNINNAKQLAAGYNPEGNMINEDNSEIKKYNQGVQPINFSNDNVSKTSGIYSDALRRGKAHLMTALGGFEIQPLPKVYGGDYNKALRIYYGCYDKSFDKVWTDEKGNKLIVGKSRIKQMLDLYFKYFIERQPLGQIPEEKVKQFSTMVKNFIYNVTTSLEINNTNNYQTILRIIRNDEELVKHYGVTNKNTIQQFDAKEQVIIFGDQQNKDVITSVMVAAPTLSRGGDLLKRGKNILNMINKQ